MSVKARQLKEQGAICGRDCQIRLNARCEETVEELPSGFVPAPAATVAQRLKQEGESVVQIADRLGADVKTVNPLPGDYSRRLQQTQGKTAETTGRIGHGDCQSPRAGCGS